MRHAKPSKRGEPSSAMQDGGASHDTTSAKSALHGLSFEQQQAALSPGGLPNDVLAKMEQSYGADFSDVSVLVDGKAEAQGARAFAARGNIHVAASEYAPHTEEGQRLLGHEFAHIVQQREGIGSGLMAKGGIVTDHAMEAQADAAGERAARGEKAGLTTSKTEGDAGDAIQCDKTPAQWLAELATEFSALQTAATHQNPPAWDGQSPAVGAESENYKPRPCKPEDVVDMWKAFLGPGPYSNVHPRRGTADAYRLVSDDGARSIRYGNHERKASTKHHYHEETWTYNSGANTLDIDNQVQRCPLQ